jgi:hypothetical protein
LLPIPILPVCVRGDEREEMGMRQFPVPARVYLVALCALALVVLAVSLQHVGPTQWAAIVPLALLVLVADRLSSTLGPQRVSINVGMPIALASVLLLGPYGAAIVQSVIFLAIRRAPLTSRAYNASMHSLTAFASGYVYVHVGAGEPLLSAGTDFNATSIVVPSLIAAAVHELVNAFLLVSYISLLKKLSPLRVWYGTLAESALPMFIYSIFGLMLAVVWSYVGVIAAVLVLAPLLVARWVFAEFSARQEAYEATMRSLIKSVETKDLYTRGHSERVSRASVLIGRKAGMREDRVSSLRYAGMLHDVGKLGVPTSVLQKAGRLTEEEFEAIQQHTVRGREITKDLEFLGEAIEGIHLHHERIDGRGYPLGLKGAEIPEFARIIAVADAFDSMTTTRSYRGARSVEDAVIELRNCKGSQFDPIMVEALVDAIEVEGWDASDTLPTEPPVPLESVPSFASDDDDPTAADRLGLPTATPDDASELIDDAQAARTGEDAS